MLDTQNNPFVQSLVIQMNTIEPINTFEISEGMIVPKTQRLDGVRAVKLFRTPEQTKLLNGITPNAGKLFIYIILTIQPGLDYVIINLKRYMKETHIHSRDTYYSAANELQRYGIILKAKPQTQMYWINPAYFFCGSRPLKWPSKVVKMTHKKRARKN